jgi:hypothetical protein
VRVAAVLLAALALAVPLSASAAPGGLPNAVERKRIAIHEAAAAHDWGALRKLTARGFRYSFGGPYPGGAIAFWKAEEKRGQKPLETLARITDMPYTLSGGIFFWPFAYDAPKNRLSPYERRLLGNLVRSYVGNDYFGWRAGISPNGAWTFYVRGD